MFKRGVIDLVHKSVFDFHGFALLMHISRLAEQTDA